MSTVVLVHALGSSRCAREPQVRALSDRHRVLAPDLPGHGDAEGPFTLNRAVASVHAAIGDEAGGVHLVGISVGAVVALLVGLEYPADVASLVVSGGLAHTPRLLVLQRAIVRVTPEPLLARVLAPMYSGTHLGDLQQPDVFNKTIAAFVERTAAPAKGRQEVGLA